VPRPAGRRTQAERRELAEQRVIETAVALIAEHGTRAATLARVGEAAGYSRGIVTHHFGTRDHLLRKVVQHAAGQVHASAYAGDGLLQLRGTVRAYLETIAAQTPSTRAFLRMWGEAIAADPLLACAEPSAASSVPESPTAR
jgi:AcrR family transcriptional regulator